MTFENVGGLGKHVQALKEMVVFPLLYPEVFERFKIAPPRGVLFYGPPGNNTFLPRRGCNIPVHVPLNAVLNDIKKTTLM